MSLNYRFDKPDWDKWRTRDIVRLWQGACLVADIEPPDPTGDDVWYEAQLKDFPAPFHRVWDALNWDANFVKLPLQPYSGRMLHSIDLDGFCHWANGKGFVLPEPLRDRAARFEGASSNQSPPPFPTSTDAPLKPLQRQPHQEMEILRVITELGYDATALPKNAPGKPGAKKEVRHRLNYSDSVFDGAWERLRKDQRIKDA